MMSPFIFLISILFCSALRDGNKKYRCDYKYASEIDAWLKFQEIPTDWNEARLRCRLEGGNIASPITVALKQAMLDLLQENGVNRAYTGIHATFSKGIYNSIEGVPLHQIPHTLRDFDPNLLYSKRNCLILHSDGSLEDTTCNNPYQYICYKQLKNHDKITLCGTIDLDYYLDTRTGNCYKFHRTPRTWSRAYMTCMAEGGYLAIINSETEAQVIRDIYAKNPDESIVGASRILVPGLAFIGFNDWSEYGDWLTIQGETLKEAGYDHFAPGEPNNATVGPESCGSVTRTGLLNDLWCETKFPFICEKRPGSLECRD